MTYRAPFTNNAKEDIKELKAYVVQAWSKQVWKTASDQIKHAVSIIEFQPMHERYAKTWHNLESRLTAKC